MFSCFWKWLTRKISSKRQLHIKWIVKNSLNLTGNLNKPYYDFNNCVRIPNTTTLNSMTMFWINLEYLYLCILNAPLWFFLSYYFATKMSRMSMINMHTNIFITFTQIMSFMGSNSFYFFIQRLQTIDYKS